MGLCDESNENGMTEVWGCNGIVEELEREREREKEKGRSTERRGGRGEYEGKQEAWWACVEVGLWREGNVWWKLREWNSDS